MRTLSSELRNKGFTKGKDAKDEKKKTQFSRRELEDLMGTKRDTYKRVNGSVRRK